MALDRVLLIGIMYLATAVVEFIMLWSIFQKSCFKSWKQALKTKTTDILVLLMTLSITAAVSIVLSDVIVSASYILYFSFHENKHMLNLCLSLYYAGKLLLVLFLILWMASFVLRLQSTFEETSYSINRSTMISLFVIMGIATINMLLTLFLPRLFFLINAASGVLFVIAITWITVLFGTKLQKVIIAIRNSIHVVPDHSIDISAANNKHENTNKTKNSSNTSINISKAQHQLLQVIAKQTLIAFIQAIAIIAWAIAAFLTKIVGISTVYGGMTDSILSVVFYCIFHLTSLSCLFLSFAHAHKEYNFVCGRCNQCCLDLCQMAAIKKIQREMLAQN